MLVSSVAALLALGMVMLYSSSMAQVGAKYVTMQFLWCAIGLVPCAVAASLDYRKLKPWVWVLYGVAVVLLILVLIPGIGISVKGARRWLPLGLGNFQPSELAKLALIFALAWYCERYGRQMKGFVRGVVIPGAIAGLLLGLIYPEPDRGTTMLLAGLTGLMLLLAGVRWIHLAPPVMAGTAALAVALWHDPVRSKRIFGWLNLEETKSGVGYQAYQAMLALGNGGWTGLGLGNGTQKLGFIPEHHTDFILSVIGEELGLAATMLVVVAFVIIVISGVRIAWSAPDSFGLYLGSGITLLIGLQAFINIGVVTSTLPNKGLPLPFISYGGSNLLMMLACVGILLSIARHARTTELVRSSGIEPADEDPANPFRRRRQIA